MSVFLKNTCHFTNCKKNFFNLYDLIIHIESNHLDFETVGQLEEEKPESLPLSYVLRYTGPDEFLRNEVSLNEAVIQELDVATEMVTALNNNYISCDYKEVKDRKVEARLNRDEFSQLLGGSKLFTLDNNQKKPFACNMKGCEKRYKNVNGIKYHYKKHHKMLIPSLKKSLLKHKPISRSKFEKPDVHGIPLYSYKPTMPEIVYPSPHFEDDEYVYKYTLPTSEHFSSNQVPLPNVSFNYYEVGDIEEFAGKNSTYYVANFDKF